LSTAQSGDAANFEQRVAHSPKQCTSVDAISACEQCCQLLEKNIFGQIHLKKISTAHNIPAQKWLTELYVMQRFPLKNCEKNKANQWIIDIQ
jgi:hypothetical protein